MRKKKKFSPFSPRGQKKECDKRIIRVKTRKMVKETYKDVDATIIEDFFAEKFKATQKKKVPSDKKYSYFSEFRSFNFLFLSCKISRVQVLYRLSNR